MTDILYRIYILYRNIVQFFYVKIQLSSGYISTVICKIYLLKGVNSMNGCPITDPAIAYKMKNWNFFSKWRRIAYKVTYTVATLCRSRRTCVLQQTPRLGRSVTSHAWPWRHAISAKLTGVLKSNNKVSYRKQIARHHSRHKNVWPCVEACLTL